MTQSDQTNDNIEHKMSLHKLALHQTKCYRSSLQSSPSADPAMKREMALYRRPNGSLQHIGGPNCVSNLFRPPLTDTQCASHKAHSNR